MRAKKNHRKDTTDPLAMRRGKARNNIYAVGNSTTAMRRMPPTAIRFFWSSKEIEIENDLQ
jgi:hypothetical protein